jgi:hypothetical protein
MADKKISQMALLSAVDLNPAVDYLPIVDPSEPAAADQNKRILVSSILTNAVDDGTILDQSYIGTDPNEIPLNQFLSGMAYQDPNNVTIGGGSATLTSLTATTVTGTSMVYNGTELNARLNPLAQAVSVQMTASTTVGGIQQLDNDNLDMGTNDFTVAQTDTVYSGSYHVFFIKRVDANNRIYWVVDTDGRMYFSAIVSAATVISFNTASISAYYGQSARYAVSIIRETATAAGSYAVYINGVVFASGSIAAAATVSLSNAGVRYINSSNVGSTAASTRAASSLISQFQYNRALTSAEVLSLSINSVALADRGASQTPVYESDFSAGVDGWTVAGSASVDGNIDGINGQDDWLRITCSGVSNEGAIKALPSAISAGKNNRVSLRVFLGGSNATVTGVQIQFRTAGNTTVATAQNYQIGVGAELDIVCPSATTSDSLGIIRIIAINSANSALNTSGDLVYAKFVVVNQIGLTSELIASNAQSDTGQIFDTSGNKNHALLPASGATVVGRPVSQTREVRWTNTWAGTNELQYIGGVNQAILPANAYIESIIGTVSGATPHDIIVGDGSDADRYVTITTGLAAGTTSFTLANRTTDGTNLKLTVDVDTDATMSIAWVIRYSVLEG